MTTRHTRDARCPLVPPFCPPLLSPPSPPFSPLLPPSPGARLYRQLGGLQWVWNTVLTALVFPFPLTIVFGWVNTVAWSHGSTAALPLIAVAIIAALYVLVSFPLTVIGAICGRASAVDFEAPCRTKKMPREVPSEMPWYRQPAAQMFMAGFLPFSAIYIELHYIFASVWGHKIYTLFGILFLACIMLFIVTSFITVALVYFQLAREDHRWWWRSFFSGGATGLFIYAYSFFYFFNRSSMDGGTQGHPLGAFDRYSLVVGKRRSHC